MACQGGRLRRGSSAQGWPAWHGARAGWPRTSAADCRHSPMSSLTVVSWSCRISSSTATSGYVTGKSKLRTVACMHRSCQCVGGVHARCHPVLQGQSACQIQIQIWIQIQIQVHFRRTSRGLGSRSAHPFHSGGPVKCTQVSSRPWGTLSPRGCTHAPRCALTLCRCAACRCPARSRCPGRRSPTAGRGPPSSRAGRPAAAQQLSMGPGGSRHPTSTRNQGSSW